MIVDLLLEGSLEEHAAHRLLVHTGHTPGTVHGRNGVGYLQRVVQGFQYRASPGSAVLVLTDFMDTRAACVPEALERYLGKDVKPPDTYLLRFAVNELECWLLADRVNFAAWLTIPKGRIPAAVEAIPDPKQLVVELACRSRKKGLKEQMTPHPEHGGKVGPEYTSAMSVFVSEHWDIEQARIAAPSLDRCLRRLESL
jgi:hypothetical protein